MAFGQKEEKDETGQDLDTDGKEKYSKHKAIRQEVVKVTLRQFITCSFTAVLPTSKPVELLRLDFYRQLAKKRGRLNSANVGRDTNAFTQF